METFMMHSNTKKRHATTDAEMMCNRQAKYTLPINVDNNDVIHKIGNPITRNDGIVSRLSRDCLVAIFDHIPGHGADQACLKQACKLFCTLLTHDMKRSSQININLPFTQDLTRHKETFPKLRRNAVSYRLAEYAARDGILYNVQYLYKNFESPMMLIGTMREATENGRLNVVMWLTRNSPGGIDSHFSGLISAALGGHLPVVQWFLENGMRMDGRHSFIVRCAAERGHLNILEWLESINVDMIKRCMDIVSLAASGGHLNILNWCLERGFDMTPSRHYQPHISSARNGHLETLKWLVANGFNKQHHINEATDYAARGNHWSMLQWLISIGGTISHSGTKTMLCAAQCGHVQILEWLAANGVNPRAKHDEALLRAAANNHYGVVEWLFLRGVPLNAQALVLAAERGHIDTVKWFIEHGADPTAYNARALHNAIQFGHWMVADYLNQAIQCSAAKTRLP